MDMAAADGAAASGGLSLAFLAELRAMAGEVRGRGGLSAVCTRKL